jgi:stress response protein YsnF
MEAYEETADIHKQAFVREEFSVRKEVEHNTVEVEDKIRREELDLEVQGRNIIDKTKTL